MSQRLLTILTVVNLCLLIVAGAYIWQLASQTEPEVVTDITDTAEPVAIYSSPSEETSTNTVAEQITALESRVAILENQEPLIQPVVNRSVPAPSIKTGRNDIYLGSWATTKRDWTNTGLEATIDSEDYSATARATFEAGLSIVGGIAEARLINKTTGAVISASEVSHNGSTTAYQMSATFTLFPGTNTYQVQLRSTSGELAELPSARIVISE